MARSTVEVQRDRPKLRRRPTGTRECTVCYEDFAPNWMMPSIVSRVILNFLHCTRCTESLTLSADCTTACR